MISPATSPADIALVSKLAFEIWPEHYYDIVGKPQIDFMLKKYQTAEAISKQITEERYEYYLILDGKGAVGYFAFQYRGDALFLSKLYVRQACRGKGFGRQALDHMIDAAKRKKKKKIALTINKNNVQSLKIYEMMGFKNVGPIVADIGGGFVMDDYALELEIP